MSVSAAARADHVAIKAAMGVARDVAEGRLSPAALEAAAVAECRTLVGQVIGPDDAVWPLQLEVARGVLAAGGVPADELAEWLAVQRQAEQGVDSDRAASTESAERTFEGVGVPDTAVERVSDAAEREVSWIEQALGLELPELEPAEAP